MNVIVGLLSLLILILIGIHYLLSSPSLIPEKPFIEVCMWYDDAISEYGDIARDINESYCRDKKYHFCFDQTRRFPERHPSWEKLGLIQDRLMYSKASYLVWIDADACFNYTSYLTLEDFISQYPEKNIIIQDDGLWYSDSVNCGFFIVKNNPRSLKFIRDCLNSQEQICLDHYHKHAWEQKCVSHFVLEDQKKPILQQQCQIVDYSKNLQRYEWFPENKQALVIHLAGKSSNDRVRILGKIKNKNEVFLAAQSTIN